MADIRFTDTRTGAVRIWHDGHDAVPTDPHARNRILARAWNRLSADTGLPLRHLVTTHTATIERCLESSV